MSTIKRERKRDKERERLLFDGKFPGLIALFLGTKRPWLLQKQIQKPDSILSRLPTIWIVICDIISFKKTMHGIRVLIVI